MDKNQEANLSELAALLAADIDKLSWAGKWEKEGGAVSLAHMLALVQKTLGHEKDAFMLLASTHYGACGNVDSCDAPKRDQHLEQAYAYATKAYEGFKDSFTPSDLDVYASILRKKKKDAEALVIVDEALTSAGLTGGQKALLTVGKVKSLIALNRKDEAKYLIEEIRDGGFEPKVRVRVLRSLAECEAGMGNVDHAHNLLDDATALAEVNGLKDQVTKIQSIRERLK